MHIPTLLVELLGLGLIAALAVFTSAGRWRTSRAAWRAFGRLGRRHFMSIAFVSLLTFGIGVTASALRFPLPVVHDEFSYLLAADTFAHGRLTNPTHPMWEHFETFHVLMQPTYASKYPPAQGMLLALGQVIWHPVVGVWLGSALAVGAICWMLQGWVPGRWALLGSLIVALHPFIQLYWGQNYWGGQLCMFGGALVYGALPRILKKARLAPAVAMACGAVILANARPYEGFFACLPTACVMVVWLFRQIVGKSSRERLSALTLVATPIAAIGSATVLWIGYYNYQVTGQVGKLPYSLHYDQYGATPLFLFQRPAEPPDFRHRELSRFYIDVASHEFRRQATLVDILKYKVTIALVFWLKLVHPTWTFLLVLAVAHLRTSAIRFSLATILVGFAASIPIPWLQPHYVAPVFPAIVLCIVLGCRRMSVWRRRSRRGGLTVIFGLLLLWALLMGVRIARHDADPIATYTVNRSKLIERLNSLDGLHLVIVRYGADHDTHHEWVYNDARIDDSPVVWARAMNQSKSEALLNYFSDRTVWLLEPDEHPIRFTRITR